MSLIFRGSAISRKTECYNCVTTPERPVREAGSNTGSTQMIIKLTARERATILASLRRWLSYPAAREADSIATSGGKHQPLDNGEIERLCKRITKMESRRDAVLPLGQSNNGAHGNKQ